jgi:hypothetical protein
LVDPHASVNQIAKLHRVSTHTVPAIRAREAVTIADRKQRLVSIFGNVAEIAAERMEELASGATLREAGTTAGIATDKLLALLGEHAQGVPIQVNVQVNAQALHDKLNAWAAVIETREPRKPLTPAHADEINSRPSPDDPDGEHKSAG